MASISVIVPVYKVEEYLHRCVDSILAQTFRDFDLILVDDGSPDNCGAICEAYAGKDSRIRVIHQENGGLSAARNAGIDWVFSGSESQWLAFVDSDDWIAETYLEQLYDAAEGNGCLLSVCGFLRTSGEGFPEQGQEDPKVMAWEDYYCSESIHDGVTMVAWNKLYHRSLFEGLRYPKGKLHEDEFTTYLAASKAGQIAVIEAPLYAYFQNQNGIMRSKWNPRRMQVLEALNQQILFAREKGYTQLEKKAVKQYLFSAYDQLNTLLADGSNRKYRSLLRREMRKALKLGRETGIIPMTWEKMWAYEAAYPMKPFWWLLGKVRK